MKATQTILITLVSATVTGLLHLFHFQNWMAVSPEILMGSRILVALMAFYYGFQKKNMTTWILVSMAIGLVIGVDFPEFAKNLDVFVGVFMRLIKVIIAPLLFSTLIVGIAGHSDMKQVGRMGWKALLYFEIVTTIALVVGLVAINFTRAGDGIKRDVKTVKKEVSADSLRYVAEIKGKSPETLKIYDGENQVTVTAPAKKETWKDLIYHIFPENVAKMVYDAQVLQVVVFSILFALGLFFVEDKHRTFMLSFAESLSEVMFKFTNIIMYLAPFAVGGAIAATVANMGVDILKNLFWLLATLYGALVVFVLLVFVPILLFLKINIKEFWKYVKGPATLAFATASSESALPLAMKNMEAFGVPRKIVSFVIPTGFTFNLDGSTLYLALASVFVAQAQGIELSIQTQIIMCLTLMLTSKGVAGVARASLVILTATCATFKLDDWPIAIILGIDALMDMARTMVNLVGNCLASVVVAKWEKEM